MKYKNAQEILPDHLLKELQRYASGQTLYIPKSEKKRAWGESSGARLYYRERNEKIRAQFRNGAKLEELAERYALSVDSIRKIVS